MTPAPPEVPPASSNDGEVGPAERGRHGPRDALDRASRLRLLALCLIGGLVLAAAARYLKKIDRKIEGRPSSSPTVVAQGTPTAPVFASLVCQETRRAAFTWLHLRDGEPPPITGQFTDLASAEKAALADLGSAPRSNVATGAPLGWTAGGLDALADALAPLDAPPAQMTPAALARAARALAWQAFVDARLAPAIAPRRAAQALAFAAVAERLTGTRLRDAATARWLAPAAAIGDLWWLARTAPPHELAPELDWLYRAYREPDLPARRPEDFSFATAIALIERAEVLDLPSVGQQIRTWSAKEPFAADARAYLAETRWPVELALSADLAAIGPAVVAARLLTGWGVAVPPDVAALAEVSPDAHDETGQATARAFPAARALQDLAARESKLARRVLLEEAAERMLHGAWAVRVNHQRYDETAAVQALERAAAGAFDVSPDALVRAPRLRRGEAAPPADLADRVLAAWPGWPRATERAAALAAAAGQRAKAGALMAGLAKSEGADRLPLYAAIEYGTPVARAERLRAAPPAWQVLPTVALTRDVGALEASLAKYPGALAVALELVTRLARAGKAAAASAAATAFFASEPPEADATRVSQTLARELLRAGDARAAAECVRKLPASTAWALELEARAEAAQGDLETAQAALDQAAEQGANVAATRALLALVEKKTPAEWAEVERLAGDELDQVAQVIHLAGLAFSDTPFGKRLAFVHALDRARLTPALADITALARAARAADRVAELAPALPGLLAGALKPLLNANAARPEGALRPEAELAALAALTGPLAVAQVRAVAVELAVQDASPAEIARALAWLEPAASDGAAVRALATPPEKLVARLAASE